MDPPQVEDGGGTQGESHFASLARGPSGVIYDVQAGPVFVSGGAVLLGTKNGIFEHGPLGLLNRVLARKSRVKQQNGFGVFVYSNGPGRGVVAESDHGSMSEAREAAQAFVQAITDRTFQGD